MLKDLDYNRKGDSGCLLQRALFRTSVLVLVCTVHIYRNFYRVLQSGGGSYSLKEKKERKIFVRKEHFIIITNAI